MRKTYKFSHSISQGGSVYIHRTIEKKKIRNKEILRQALRAVEKEFELIDVTIEIYDSIFFFFHKLKPIQGLAIILWREKELEEAKDLFTLILKLNKNDNQGIRFCIAGIFKGLSWEEFMEIDEKRAETGDYERIDSLFEEQNKIHKFYVTPEI